MVSVRGRPARVRSGPVPSIFLPRGMPVRFECPLLGRRYRRYYDVVLSLIRAEMSSVLQAAGL